MNKRRVLTSALLVIGLLAALPGISHAKSQTAPGKLLWRSHQQGKTLWTRSSLDSDQIQCYVDYYICLWDGLTTYGINETEVGTLHISIYFELESRDTFYWQYSEVVSGPSINAKHSFNCVDHHWFSNTSCKLGLATH